MCVVIALVSVTDATFLAREASNLIFRSDYGHAKWFAAWRAALFMNVTHIGLCLEREHARHNASTAGAISTVEAHRPAFMFLDINTPGANGVKVAGVPRPCAGHLHDGARIARRHGADVSHAFGVRASAARGS